MTAMLDAEVRAFVEARGVLLGAGGLPPRDGRPHRFPTEDHPDRRDGAVLRWPDGAGWVMVHGEDPKPVYFSAGKTRRLSAAARDRIAEARRAREAETAAQQAAVAVRARRFLAGCVLATAAHPYLKRKRVPPYRLRVTSDRALARAYGLRPPLLVVPLIDPDGHVASLEFIDADGTKRFLSGGRKTGCSLPIGTPTGQPGETIYVGEGVGTMHTVYEATGCPSVASLDCGNMLPVARALRARHPKAKIVVCADDDADTPGNPGLSHATEAARAVGGLVAVPRFGKVAKGGRSHAH
jgi:putative DNA primase/helicase